MKRLLLVYVCFFSGIGIQANFGVSLGSYTEISRANTALSVAQGQFEQEISIVQIQRNAGIFHRVIVGPFMDRLSAEISLMLPAIRVTAVYGFLHTT